MPKVSTWFVCSLALAGCQGPRRAADVRLSEYRSFTVARRDGDVVYVPGASSTIPAASSQVLLPGATFKVATDVLERLEAQREMLRTSLYEDLRGDAVATVQAEAALRRESIYVNAAADLAASYDRLHERFRVQAEPAGVDWARIAVLAGFPDPDPTSRRSPVPQRPRSALELAEARDRRESIRARNLEFWSAVDVTVELNRGRLRQSLTDWLADTELAKLEAEKRAEAEANEMRTAIPSLEPLLVSPMLAVQGASGHSLSIPPSQLVWSPWKGGAAGGWNAQQRMLARRRLFLGSRGYTLNQTGPDATQEFVSWQRLTLAGR